ncbi:MAG: NAD(P)-binding domain-containing protein [Acidimicrobiaceae bacterium]|nr:NAD(P)-binding domain-containing protein [Acidimicrobiaceae bacterium]
MYTIFLEAASRLFTVVDVALDFWKGWSDAMDPGVVVLTESEIRGLTNLNTELVDAVEDGFKVLAAGGVSTPPPMMFTVDSDNEVDVKAAWVRSWGILSIKVATGFFENPALGLPSGNSVLLLLDATTGQTRAVLLEGGYLTTLRAAAAGAIAAKWLAPSGAATVGVIGTGQLARWHARALLLDRELDSVLVYGRNPDRANALIDDLKEHTNARIAHSKSVQEVVEASDIVVTCTSAHEILVRSEWVHPGMHITAAGADATGKQELDPEILYRADRVVCDLRAQALTQGECQHVTDPSMSSDGSWLTELGDVVAGMAPGRIKDDEITVCDLTGVGVQDAAIARYVLGKALGTAPVAAIDPGVRRGVIV